MTATVEKLSGGNGWAWFVCRERPEVDWATAWAETQRIIASAVKAGTHWATFSDRCSSCGKNVSAIMHIANGKHYCEACDPTQEANKKPAGGKASGQGKNVER